MVKLRGINNECATLPDYYGQDISIRVSSDFDIRDGASIVRIETTYKGVTTIIKNHSEKYELSQRELLDILYKTHQDIIQKQLFTVNVLYPTLKMPEW